MDSLRFKKNNNLDITKNSLSNKNDFFIEAEEKYQHDTKVYVFGQKFDIDEIEIVREVKKENTSINDDFAFESFEYVPATFFEEELKNKKHVAENKIDTIKSSIMQVKRKFSFMRYSSAFAVATLVIIFSGGFFISKGADIKNQVLGVSDEAFDNVNVAISGIKDNDFTASSDNFEKAYDNFSAMANSLENLGGTTIAVSRFIPGASQLSSGYELIQVGKHLSAAGQKISKVAKNLEELKNHSLQLDSNEKISALNIFRSLEKDVALIEGDLAMATESLKKVNLRDIPKDKRESVEELKIKLPIIVRGVEEFSRNSHIIADLLGANGPRKYLFLFQNNQEMRATGGFIGSYGLLDIEGSGRIRNFFIDGIFNPDGQLTSRIIPPKPIQKISAAWSLHDSNWFPDFPLSAKKAISFYEKTGGPTVDGVITLTPTVMQKLLIITGPIYMEEYDTELTADNFIQNIQYEVEENYDKEENRPKKILSDLAPLVLDKLLSSGDVEIIAKTISTLSEALGEKHILIYSSNEELQEIISEIGWSGEILNTEGDYLSIINSNVNGYKTDGVIDETVNVQTEISEDGEIIDTVWIKRKHNGGNENYEWWNKVNANYMRVYVPEGVELLEVEGQTREFNDAPLDYAALDFERDADIQREEDTMQIDEVTGTRTYSENGKTVFANWTYVSPQEEVVIKYKYKLPFKINLKAKKEFDSFSLLVQKQSGSVGTKFNYEIKYPQDWSTEWRTENISEDNKSLQLDGVLKKDVFSGAVFIKNN